MHSGDPNFPEKDGADIETDMPNSIGYSNSNVDITDAKQLEALLAWDAAQVEKIGIESLDGSANKKRRLNPPAPSPRAGGAGASVIEASGTGNNCFYLAGMIINAMKTESDRSEAMGIISNGYCGILSFFKHAVIYVLQHVEDCQHTDRDSSLTITTSMLQHLRRLVSTTGLIVSIGHAVCIAEKNELKAVDNTQIECLRSLLFYVHIMAVDAALVACGEAISDFEGEADESQDILRHRYALLITIVNSTVRIVGAGGRLCQFNSFEVSEGCMMQFLTNVASRCNSLQQKKSLNQFQQDRETSDDKLGMYHSLEIQKDVLVSGYKQQELLLHLFAVLNFPQTGHLTASFWSEPSSNSSGRHSFSNPWSPFPLLEAQWRVLNLKQQTTSVYLCMENLLDAARSITLAEYVAPNPVTSVTSANCSEECDSEFSRAPKASPPTCRDDGLVVATVWLCRAASSCLSSSTRTGESNVILNQRMAILMKKLIGKFQAKLM